MRNALSIACRLGLCLVLELTLSVACATAQPYGTSIVPPPKKADLGGFKPPDNWQVFGGELWVGQLWRRIPPAYGEHVLLIAPDPTDLPNVIGNALKLTQVQEPPRPLFSYPSRSAALDALAEGKSPANTRSVCGVPALVLDETELPAGKEPQRALELIETRNALGWVNVATHKQEDETTALFDEFAPSCPASITAALNAQPLPGWAFDGPRWIHEIATWNTHNAIVDMVKLDPQESIDSAALIAMQVPEPLTLRPPTLLSSESVTRCGRDARILTWSAPPDIANSGRIRETVVSDASAYYVFIETEHSQKALVDYGPIEAFCPIEPL